MKELAYLHSAIYTIPIVSKRSDMDHTYSFTCKLHHACLSFVSIHQMAPPVTEVADNHAIAAYYSFIDPEGMRG